MATRMSGTSAANDFVRILMVLYQQKGAAASGLAPVGKTDFKKSLEIRPRAGRRGVTGRIGRIDCMYGAVRNGLRFFCAHALNPYFSRCVRISAASRDRWRAQGRKGAPPPQKRRSIIDRHTLVLPMTSVMAGGHVIVSFECIHSLIRRFQHGFKIITLFV